MTHDPVTPERAAPPSTTAILLAGGEGSRMGGPVPKQYLPLKGKVVARYSFDLLLASPTIDAVVVVCTEQYRNFFVTHSDKPVSFALPGQQRQDSVYSGLQQVSASTQIVVVHDAARPLITEHMLEQVVAEAEQHGAATTGMPVIPTVKLASDNGFVEQTLDRDRVWEIQTPQAVRCDIMRLGFLKAQDSQLTVTDDVSLAELVGHPVKLVRGTYSNLKITTPTDLAVAETLVRRGPEAPAAAKKMETTPEGTILASK